MAKQGAIVIPTINEEENIEPLVKGIMAQNLGLNLIFVDDNSSDNTRKIIRGLMKKNNLIHLIEREKKLGIGTAYIAGMRYAIEALGSRIIFTMDADLSHDPNDLPKFLDEINSGADIVIGSRYVKGGKIIGWTFYRKLMSRVANFLAKIVLGLKVSDVTTGFRCYKREVLEGINYKEIKSNGYSTLQELLYLAIRKKFKVKEFPLVLVDRIQGESKLSKSETVKFFMNLMELKWKTISGRI